jgi:flavin-dependent dehydrogenase
MMDVLVIGGGPAGIAVAERIARAGPRVMLVEASRSRTNPRLGQILSPVARPLLSSLGISDRIGPQGHTAVLGVLSRWGNGTPVSNDCYFSPYGHGWSLDRGRFDRASAAAAASAGVQIVRDAQVRWLANHDGHWHSTILSGGSAARIEARFVMDATGRRASVARALGVPEIRYDRLMSLVGTFEAATGIVESRLVLEAVQEGWWYATPAAGGRIVAAYFTDADILKRCRRSRGGRRPLSATWDKLMRATEDVRRYVSGMSRIGLEAFDCSTRRLACATGERWFAVGDACMSLDPLSAQGLLTALSSGLRASDCVLSILQGNGGAAELYVDWLDKLFSDYMRDRQYHYCREERWSEYEFWLRRQGRHFDPLCWWQLQEAKSAS